MGTRHHAGVLQWTSVVDLANRNRKVQTERWVKRQPRGKWREPAVMGSASHPELFIKWSAKMDISSALKHPLFHHHYPSKSVFGEATSLLTNVYTTTNSHNLNPPSIPHHPQTQHGDDNGTSPQQNLFRHFQDHPSETTFAAFSPPGCRCLSYVAGCSRLLKDGEQISTEEVPLYTVQSWRMFLHAELVFDYPL